MLDGRNSASISANLRLAGKEKSTGKRHRRRKRYTEIVSGVEMASASVQNNVPIETSSPCSYVSLPGIPSNAHKRNAMEKKTLAKSTRKTRKKMN